MRHHKRLFITAILLAIIFQLFFRYKIIAVGPYDLKDDRLTLTVYLKQKNAPEWRQTQFKSLNQAKAYLEQTILLKEDSGRRFIWNIGVDQDYIEDF